LRTCQSVKTMIKIFLVNLFVLFFPILCIGQQKDTQFIIDQKNNRNRTDSLQAEFNKRKPYFFIELEINKDKTAISKNTKFYATFKDSRFEALDLGNNQFEFSSLPDSLQFTLQWDSVKVSTGTISKVMFEHGAHVKFGYYNNLLALREQWKSIRKNEDFNEYDDMPSPYITAIQNKKLIRAARKNMILPIEFTVFNPITFGDGVVIISQMIRLKKRKG
jgi:hypothetical protein